MSILKRKGEIEKLLLKALRESHLLKRRRTLRREEGMRETGQEKKKRDSLLYPQESAGRYTRPSE